jgi:NAD(P)-dependent dehydrogenase (short-subunit alcohol dehydrogenase family)
MRNHDKSYKIVDFAKTHNLPLEVVQLDITDEESVKDTIDIIVAKQRRIDIAVNNGGYGSTGALEGFSNDEIKAQFEIC